MTLENQNNEQENLSNDEISDADNPQNYPDQIAQNTEVKEEQTAEEKVNKEKTVENAANKTEKKAEEEEEETKSNKTAEAETANKPNATKNESAENPTKKAVNLFDLDAFRVELAKKNPSLTFPNDDPMQIPFIANQILVENLKSFLDAERDFFKNEIQTLIKNLEEEKSKYIKEFNQSAQKIVFDANNLFEKEATSFQSHLKNYVLEKKRKVLSMKLLKKAQRTYKKRLLIALIMS